MVTADPIMEVDQLIAALDKGEIEKARQLAMQLREDLARDSLLTTSQAAKELGVRSRNTLKALVRAEGIRTIANGNRMMIPRSEVERLRTSRTTAGIVASDRLHDVSAMLGSDDGMSQDDLNALEAARPGRLPWEGR
ncbi:MAG: hypothetical protein NVS2B16_34740 [Chloroflexota bacterium]